MDELEISGKRYISAKRAAKEHKYHSDYIGQLVRGGKVEGQKVGRAWYVDSQSLSAYLNKEPSEVKLEVVEPKIEIIKEEPKIEAVKEVVIEKPVEIVREENIVPIHKKELPTVFPVKKIGGLTYVADDEPLLPQTSRVEKKNDRLQYQEEELGAQEVRIIEHQPKINNKRVAGKVLSLVIIGAAIFSLTVSASYIVNSLTMVQGGHTTASVFLANF